MIKSERTVEEISGQQTIYEHVLEYSEDGSLKDEYHYQLEYRDAVDGCGLNTTGIITKKIKEGKILNEDVYVGMSGCDTGGGHIIGLEKGDP